MERRASDYTLLTIPNHFGRKEIELFSFHFKASQLNSIDAFLAKRGEDYISELNEFDEGRNQRFFHSRTYDDCGKVAIANQLIKCEVLHSLLEPKEDHWLQYLWNVMNDVSRSEFQKNQLKIISFNYDRVIEQYFQIALTNAYGVEQNEATELRKSIEIVHVYGNLQDLEERPYGVQTDSIEKVAACIKVIPEAREANDTEFTRSKEIIDWAEKICFVGFGFDATNMARLGFPDKNLSGKKIYSTLYGLTLAEVHSANKLLGGYFNGSDIDWTVYLNDKTLEYMRETGFFL